jgi:NAD+ diphosphatase
MAKTKYCPWCGQSLTVKNINGKDYRACPSEECNYVFWDNPVPVVAAIIEYQGAVLLARNKAWPEQVFALVTGFLEKRESPEDAIVREVKEELGLDATIVGLVGIYAFFKMNQLIVAYHVSAEGNIVLGDEIVETKLVQPEKLRPWPFGTGIAVRDWLLRRGITPLS